VVEKWCRAPATGPRPATRAHTANPLVPTKMQEITIIQNPHPRLGTSVRPSTTAPPNTTAPPSVTVQPGTGASYTVTGAPLILEFQKILLRAAVPPEGDVIFTAAHLSRSADWFWRTVK